MQPIAYRILVDKPCQEDWSAMKDAGQGRHCANCQRTLVDFSTYSDAELLAYLQQNPGACGRFADRQLNRSLRFTPPPQQATTIPKWIAGAFLLAAAQSAAAQQNGQLSPELPKCDDSTAAVELRLEGYRPLTPDSTATNRTDTAAAESDTTYCRPCLQLDSLRERYFQDSTRLLKLMADGGTQFHTLGFAVIETKSLDDLPWIPIQPEAKPVLSKALPPAPALPGQGPVKATPQPAPGLPVRPFPTLEAILPKRLTASGEPAEQDEC